MKKICFSLLAFFATFLSLNAQEIWLETGLKGGAGASFLFNQNIADDNDYTYKFTPMYGFGAKFAVNFGPFHGISLEGLYNQAGQDFDYRLTGVQGDLENQIQWKSLDAYLLYRYITKRVYLEAGPMYSFVQSVEQTDNNAEIANPENFYEKNYLAGVFGFGGYVAGSNTFSVGLGIRLHYGFTDFVSSQGQLLGYPNPSRDSAYDSVEKTHPVFGQVLLEFNFGLGHFARTSCSERMRFFGSGRR